MGAREASQGKLHGTTAVTADRCARAAYDAWERGVALLPVAGPRLLPSVQLQPQGHLFAVDREPPARAQPLPTRLLGRLRPRAGAADGV